MDWTRVQWAVPNAFNPESQEIAVLLREKWRNSVCFMRTSCCRTSFVRKLAHVRLHCHTAEYEKLPNAKGESEIPKDGRSRLSVVKCIRISLYPNFVEFPLRYWQLFSHLISFLPSMETRGSLPYLQQPVTEPYPEPLKSSRFLQNQLPSHQRKYFPPIYAKVSQVVCTHQAGTLARIWYEFIILPRSRQISLLSTALWSQTPLTF
jgi:hypothetical protein